MNLVNEAFGLFIESHPLDMMDADDPRFEELYQKECQIFVLFDKMTEEEHSEYRKKVTEFIYNRN
jgi:hypothetical protein